MKFLKNKTATAVSIEFVELEDSAGDIDMVKEVEVKCQAPPENQKPNYLFFREEGVDIYIDKRLKISGKVKIKKEGFWKLSFLYADGVLVPF